MLPTPPLARSGRRVRFVSVMISLLSVLLASSLVAADLDLKRVTPVPAGQPIPIQDFVRPAFWSEVTINPAGTHVAALGALGSEYDQLMVIDIRNGKVDGYRGFDQGTADGVWWLDDTHVGFVMSMVGNQPLGALFAADINNLRDTYPVYEQLRPSVVGIPLQNRLQPLVPVNPRGGGGGGGRFGPAAPAPDPDAPGVVRVDASVFGGRFARPQTARFGLQIQWDDIDVLNAKHVIGSYPKPSGGQVVNYLPDARGELGFARVGGQGGQRWQRWDGSAWQSVDLDTAKFEVLGAGNAPGQLIVREIVHGEKPGTVLVFDATNGTPGEVLLAAEGYDFAGELHRDEHTGLVVGATVFNSGPANIWFDAGMASVQQLADRAFKDKFADIVGRSADGRVFLIATSSDREPTSYYSIDLASKAVGLLKSSRPWLNPERLQRTSALKYRIAGGNRIDAYVTLPAGASAERPVPMIVLAPTAADARVDNLFNPLAQYFASRGYAVLTLNHRGSTGYRWMSSPDELGNPASIPADVVAATQTVLKTGLINPQRVGLFGEGFSGWAALEAAAMAPDVFKAVAVNGAIYDWESRTQRPGGARQLGYANIPDAAAISPAKHAGQLRAAVFVAGARTDRATPFTETEAYIAALKAAGVTHDTFLINHDTKRMDELENRVEMFGHVEAFLRQRL